MNRAANLRGLVGFLVAVAAASAMAAEASRAQELERAQSAYTALQARYGDQHPRLTEARLRVSLWQRFEREARQEPLALQRAWVELDVLRLRTLEKHPDFIAQQARVGAMASQFKTAPSSPDVLLEAVGDQAALGTHLGENHPKYQDQVRKTAAFRRHLLAEGNASRYDVNHPKMQAITAEIAELEKR